MTTDAQTALTQVREALAAGPRPGEWRVSKYRDGRQALIYDADDFEVARVCYPNRDADAALIAACSPANMATILAHGEAQAAANERLTAECDELRRQLAEAEQEALRYRWLRNEANTARKCDPMVCIYPLDEQDLIDGDRLDIAIDAAMELTRPAEEA
jgi:hypothetical protein